jgi:hypothetical protein
VVGRATSSAVVGEDARRARRLDRVPSAIRERSERSRAANEERRFPDRVGSVTGVVGAAGGLGGFFPPSLVMGIVKSVTARYALGFALMALVALAGLVVLRAVRVPQAAAAALAHPSPPTEGPADPPAAARVAVMTPGRAARISA